jgi:hypothetical protein
MRQASWWTGPGRLIVIILHLKPASEWVHDATESNGQGRKAHTCTQVASWDLHSSNRGVGDGQEMDNLLRVGDWRSPRSEIGYLKDWRLARYWQSPGFEIGYLRARSGVGDFAISGVGDWQCPGPVRGRRLAILWVGDWQSPESEIDNPQSRRLTISGVGD